MTIEEDLVEEIARLYGYSRLPSQLPDGPLAVQPEEDRREIVWEQCVKDVLAGAGYTEIMSYSFVPRSWLKDAGEDGSHVIAVTNPLTDDLAVMRTSLVPSLLAVIAENQERRDALHFFELAKVYRWEDGKPQERLRLAIAVVQKAGHDEDALRAAKGIAAHVLQNMGVPVTHIRMTQQPQSATEWRDPARSVCIEVGGVIRGYVGIVRDGLTSAFGVDRVVACATFKFEELCALASTLRPYTPMPKYPPVTRDLAFIVPKAVSYADIVAVLRKQPLVASVELFDLFEGEKIGKDKKSLAFSVAYQSPEKTLTTEEVDAVQAVMVKELEKKFGAQFRNF